MKATDVVNTGYYPRPHQEWLHRKVKRFNVVVAHRRFGKTIFCLSDMLDSLIKNPRKNPQGAYLGPTFGSAKRVAWSYMKDMVRDFPGVEMKEGELKIIIPRADTRDEVRIFMLGAENPGAIRGIYLDHCVLDEFSEFAPEVWSEVIRPALSDRNGGATFIFTPRGANHSYDIYRYAISGKSDEWAGFMFKASDTKILPQKELDAAREVMSEESYAQEYEVDFSAALVGAYYKHEMGKANEQNRITRVPYDSHALVWTAWDLGIDDSTAIWFIQEAGRELHVIDYMEVSGKGLDFIVGEVKGKSYDYAGHVMPHDVAVRELSSGRSRLQILEDKLKLRGISVAPKMKVEDGIAATRALLGRMWFDEYNCGQGIECLKSYEREFDSKNGVYKLRPKHNWASHGADAMRTFSTGYRLEEDKPKYDDMPAQADSEYNIMGF